MISPELHEVLVPKSVVDERYEVGHVVHEAPEINTAVFVATDTKNDEEVALKVLQISDKDNDLLYGPTRYLREFAALTNINHTNVMQAIGAGALRGANNAKAQYIVMPYARGGTVPVSTYDRKDMQEAAFRWDLALDIGEGLNAMHKEGFVHGDVKPENALRYKSKGVIADFGTVTSVNDSELSERFPFNKELLKRSKSSSPPFVGTVMYASPEQLSVKSEKCIEPASDMYSWSLMTLHSLMGRHPYGQKTKSPTVAHCNARRPVPSGGPLPTKLYDLLDQCRRFDKSHRPSDFEEVLGLGRSILQLEAVGYTK